MFRGLAEYMIVFLRCALDFKGNKKLMDTRQSSKGYALYIEVNIVVFARVSKLVHNRNYH
jgi:hypothetical protein